MTKKKHIRGPKWRTKKTYGDVFKNLLYSKTIMIASHIGTNIDVYPCGMKGTVSNMGFLLYIFFNN